MTERRERERESEKERTFDCIALPFISVSYMKVMYMWLTAYNRGKYPTEEYIRNAKRSDHRVSVEPDKAGKVNRGQIMEDII